MAKPQEYRVNSLKSYVQFVEDRRKAITEPLWYRGCGRQNYKLTPSLFRHPTSTTINDFVALEKQILGRFRQRAVPFLQRALRSEWELLFFVQHYGVPTRLLDWSENPFIALYFALTFADYTYNNGIIKFNSDVAIWIFNPVSWNEKAMSHLSYRGILGAEDDPLNGYKPFNEVARLNVHPVALFGIHNSQRIVAQRGTFTIFGSNILPMEEIFDTDGFPPDSLVKVLILKRHLPDILESLINIGITDSVVFPDITGLANELKRYYKFEV